MKKITLLILSFALFGGLLIACSPSAAPRATQISGSTPTTAAPAPTEAPTEPPTPSATKVLLAATAGTDLQPVQAALTELSGKSGLTLVSLPAIQTTDLTQEVKVAVMLTPPANLAELLAAAPQTQFVVVTAADLPASANLTVIRIKPENQAFVAGFISVLLSTDYRGAGLLPTDGPLGAGLKEAFVNGGHYFCGVCAPGWPLKVYYPVVGEQPSAADGPTWQAAAAGLFDNQKVEVYYLTPESIRPEVISYLQGKTQLDKSVILLGNQAPPDGLLAQWAATIHFDIAAGLAQVWPDVSAGKASAAQDAPLLVDHINTDLLGAGRMRLVNDMMAELKTGKLLPMSVPQQ